MALMLTRDNVLSRLGSYRDSAKGLLSRSDGALKQGVRTSLISFSSFSFGVLQGRFKDKGGLTMFGLPVDLLAGAAFHLFGLFPSARPYANVLHAVGDGAFASFFNTTGYRVGERWAEGGSFTSGLSGIFGDADKPVTGGSSMADKELASLVRAE